MPAARKTRRWKERRGIDQSDWTMTWMMGASPTRWNYPWSSETHRPNLDAMTKGACVKRPTTALASKRAPLDHTGGIQVHPACYDNRPAVGQQDARPLPRRDPRRTRASRGLIGVGRAGPRGASHQTCGSGDAVERSWSRGKDSTISPRAPKLDSTRKDLRRHVLHLCARHAKLRRTGYRKVQRP